MSECSGRFHVEQGLHQGNGVMLFLSSIFAAGTYVTYHAFRGGETHLGLLGGFQEET